MNFTNNKKKNLLAATTDIMRKDGGENLSRENTSTGCEISSLMKLTANIINFYGNSEGLD